MIDAREVRVSRGRREVVHGVSLHVEAGSWVSVVGPNGAGKSSLLLALAALLPADGEVLLDGRPVRERSTRERAREIALVPQQPVIPDALTVEEYVLLGRTPHLSLFGSEARSDHVLADTVLGKVDLAWAADRLVSTLSGGEFHLADFGPPRDPLDWGLSRMVRYGDGASTADNFAGELPQILRAAGLRCEGERDRMRTGFGALCFYRAGR